MENLEHRVVLLLFLFTLDHCSFSANLYPSLKVTKTQLWVLTFCVRQSVFVTSWMRPMCVWQECLLWNEPTYFCSSLAESEPVICINILYMAETWATQIWNERLVLLHKDNYWYKNQMKIANGNICTLSAFVCQIASILLLLHKLRQQPNKACRWKCFHIFCIFVPDCIYILLPKYWDTNQIKHASKTIC